jgi:hypothetical protein
LMQACGPHQRRDTFAEEAATMEQLLTSTAEGGGWLDRADAGTIED